MAKSDLKAKPGEAKADARNAAPDTDTDEETDAFIGPSPNPKTNLVLADIALRGGGLLVRHAIERGLLGRRYAPEKASKILKGRTVSEALLGTAVAKLATKSVPGAILVGGGLLAKTLYDRRKGDRAKAKGEFKLEQMAEDGKKRKA